jgi:hypothetical protein
MNVINMILVTNGSYDYDHGYVYGTYDKDIWIS